LNATVVLGHDDLPDADISIATYWPTAYTVADHAGSLFKAYFIQDFEAEFVAEDDPQHTRARRTYNLPLRHICLGHHMQQRIEQTTGLPAEVVDFALDSVFRLERPAGARNDPPRVLYFARPGLRRRGYEVGVEALRRLKELSQSVEIVFFGSPDRELGEVPFPFRNLGVLEAPAVAQAMNDADILLTFSLTNISNVPFEGMACGCAVVDLDLPNVSTMVEPGTCLLAQFEPGALADALHTLVTDPELRARLGSCGAETVKSRTWERTAELFEVALRNTTFVGAHRD
jgi:glycosyltransferase involved in cell wall biosynthesis